MPQPPVFQFLRPRNQLLLLASVCGYLWLFTFNPLLLMIAGWAAASLAVGFAQARGLLAEVRASREHPARAFQKSAVAVSLKVAATSADRKSPELVLIEDYFPPATTNKVQRLAERPLAAGEATQIDYIGACEHRRGPYVIGPVRLEAYDCFGFFRREVYLEEFTELLVYPQAVELNEADLLGEGTLAHVGLDMTRRLGRSEEFVGLREYRPGDPPRIVHWRSTARHGAPMVKEFQEEITTLVTLFADLGRLGLAGVGDQTSVEYGIKCCASLAKRAIERGHRLQLFAVGAKVERIPPGSGTGHLLSVLDRLAMLKAEGENAFPVVVGDLARGLERGSTAVMVQGATTVDAPALSRAIDIMKMRRILPIVVLVDDRAFIKIFAEQELKHHKAAPLEQLERELALRGARVHTIRRAKTMEQALVQGLERAAS